MQLMIAWADGLTARPLAWALVLLLVGSVLLGAPLVRKRIAAHRARARRRPPSIEERNKVIEAEARERAELERLVGDAREAIRLGCAQLDARLERMEGLVARAERLEGEAAARVPSVEVRSIRPASGGEPIHVDPAESEIYALADAGHGAIDIASRLQEHVGKVELMLALRRGR